METQQSSDTTYRVYDYDRVDSDGNKRELHVEKSITVSMILMRIMKFILKLKKKMALLLLNMYKKVFSVYKWEIQEEASFQQNQPFQLASVIEGEGILRTTNGEYSKKEITLFFLLELKVLL